MQLSSKTALVTGGSRGIGRSICVALAKQGARVVINFASREDEAIKTADLIKEAGGVAPILKRFDVGDSSQVDQALSELKDVCDGMDILVNNAGIVRDGLLVRYKDDDWRDVMRTNLDGAFYCARACAKSMMKKRWGRVINISSISGEMGNAGQPAYVSAKAGLIGFTKAMAHELASRGITVNAVTPGFIETDMTSRLSDALKQEYLKFIPMGFMGSPEDVAHAVTFLASDGARYMTGHVLSVNGGMYM